MRKVSVFILAALVISGFSSVAKADGWGESNRCDYRRYGLDAEKFFLYITQDTPYTSWRLWPGKEKMRAGEGPHNAFFTTFVNPVAYRSIAQKEGMAFGSLIVTENYTPGQKLSSLTVKIRIKDYAPDSGDWYWFQYAPDGKVTAEGKGEECMVCHHLRLFILSDFGVHFFYPTSLSVRDIYMAHCSGPSPPLFYSNKVSGLSPPVPSDVWSETTATLASLHDNNLTQEAL